MENEPHRSPVLVFAISGENHGVRLQAIREIHDAEEIHRIPLAPPIIRGLTDVRGRMVTAIDLPAMLVGRESAWESPGQLLIVSEPRDHLALWVSDEIDLWTLDLKELRQRPAGEGEPEVFEGFVSAQSSIVNLISIEKLFHHCEREVLRRYRMAS
jgi:chemotaxis signal transduction protein